MTESKIVYFDKPGTDNTQPLAKIVAEAASELQIDTVVVASNSGDTGLVFAEALKGQDVNLVSVTEHAGFKGGDDWQITRDNWQALEDAGAKVLICSHALSGVERSITNKFGGVSRVEVIAHTLRRFGQGMKVTVEVAVMAADAGMVSTDKDIIAVGGAGKGADTAVVLRAAHQNNFFDLKIRRILAMPLN